MRNIPVPTLKRIVSNTIRNLNGYHLLCRHDSNITFIIINYEEQQTKTGYKNKG